jgi:hypothetical protein
MIVRLARLVRTPSRFHRGRRSELIRGVGSGKGGRSGPGEGGGVFGRRAPESLRPLAGNVLKTMLRETYQWLIA